MKLLLIVAGTLVVLILFSGCYRNAVAEDAHRFSKRRV
jgi:hypothetical protein